MLVQTKSGNKLTGFFRGKVVKHCLSGIGRCKVFIPGVYPEELEKDYDKLPDAEQISPLFGGSLEGNGVFSYPNLGSTVICGFWNEDQNFPFFFGSTLGGDKCKTQYGKVDCDTDPNKVKSGNDAIKHVINSGNTRIEIYETGYIQINTLGETTKDNTKITIDGKGNLLISSSKKVQVNSPNVSVTSTGALTFEAGNILLKSSTNTVIDSPNLIVGSGNSIKMESPSIKLKASVLGSFDGLKHSVTFN